MDCQSKGLYVHSRVHPRNTRGHSICNNTEYTYTALEMRPEHNADVPNDSLGAYNPAPVNNPL